MPINKILAVLAESWRFYTNLSANIVISKVKEMDTLHNTFWFSLPFALPFDSHLQTYVLIKQKRGEIPPLFSTSLQVTQIVARDAVTT